jgi:flagellar biosynthesis protein FliQ
MDEGKVLEVSRHALEMILIIGGPVLIVGLVVGVIVSIFQAATQVNEPTLSFLPKMVAMFATFFVLGSWMLSVMTDYITTLWGSIPNLIH